MGESSLFRRRGDGLHGVATNAQTARTSGCPFLKALCEAVLLRPRREGACRSGCGTSVFRRSVTVVLWAERCSSALAEKRRSTKLMSSTAILRQRTATLYVGPPVRQYCEQRTCRTPTVSRVAFENFFPRSDLGDRDRRFARLPKFSLLNSLGGSLLAGISIAGVLPRASLSGGLL